MNNLKMAGWKQLYILHGKNYMDIDELFKFECKKFSISYMVVMGYIEGNMSLYRFTDKFIDEVIDNA